MLLPRPFLFTLSCSLPLLFKSAVAANPPISNDLFTKFVRYSKFSAAAYADNCPTPPGGATVAKFFNIASTDTQAYLFRDDAAKEMIVSFRGTSSLQDFIVDFNQTLVPFNSVGIACGGCLAHGGYVDAWNSASSQVIDAINTEMNTHPGYVLTVTGHSLGASLAALASASMASMNLGMNLTTYTFGQPRTGNPTFANLVDGLLPEGKMFRVTHSNDGVPQTIPVSAGYRHHSTEFWENDPAAAGNTVKCSGQEPPDCNNSVRGTGIGANATGINLAHLVYSGVSVGNPLDGGRSACRGS
ncbi:Alpha/Beta hydrolase protein [Leptodontidium sp. 2 PMI_412]|nr:Alpha/Beta hydrolase protein [Leptodontidium sp. 2 PMI_412]